MPNITTETRTILSIRLDMPRDVLTQLHNLDQAAEVELVVNTYRRPIVKKLTYRDIELLREVYAQEHVGAASRHL